jgi:hypothetical protein
MTGASGEGVVPAVGAPTDTEAASVEPVVEDRELGRVGRLLLGAAIVVGVIVASTSWYGLLWFVAYGAVGAILLVRRPRNPIGWILFGMAWAFALTPLQVNATIDQFQAGPPLGVALPTLASTVASSLIFPMYALLAFVFPSGRLPPGRWGTVARISLCAGFLAALVPIFAPRLNVNLPSHPGGVLVPNPIAIAPDLVLWQFWELGFGLVLVLVALSATSLVVRARAARGIERQQLRWISASLVFVVISVVGGLSVSTVDEGAVQGGALVPAIFAFATVPLSIGVAVMRYRLYEIDTIINRAIVYGLLTAILAGASAAAIGVTQTLFEGVLGPGSTLTVVITTLLVVSAFNPIKNRLEAIVDRRFKPAPDPATALRAFVEELRESVAQPDRTRAFRRLVELAVPEFASGAEARWTEADATEGRAIAGPEGATYMTPITVVAGNELAELRLAGAGTFRAEDRVREALVAVLEETAPATA